VIKKTTRLRNLVRSPGLEFLVEAHNGLSARIAAEAGFPGLWASGLALSASLGVRDANEASWTQVLELVEFMADATSVPILHDADTGYGNFNNVRRLVRKLEDRHVAGVCIEDKVFPKTNSFLDCCAADLAPTDEFCGRIQAAKDAQRDDDFVVCARTEAFCVGAGLAEALARGDAYRRAGADALVVHSKRADVSEIDAFAHEWGRRLPLVIIPTRYATTPSRVFAELGISVVIWANHLVRAAAAAMQRVAERIRRDESVAGVDDEIASLERIFALQDVAELQAATARYGRPRPPEP
jgi:phosphoenolpyruvate phosphomutase